MGISKHQYLYIYKHVVITLNNGRIYQENIETFGYPIKLDYKTALLYYDKVKQHDL